MTILLSPLQNDQPLPKQSRKLRLGIIGGGRISNIQAAAARMTGRWDISAGVFSSDPKKAKDASQLWNLDEKKCYTSPEEMINEEFKSNNPIDAVMITTPNHLHFQHSKIFLENNVHVLCDKPMTSTLDEAIELNNLVENSNSIFGVSYVMSCFPMVRQARELVLQGVVGEINQIHVEFFQDWMVDSSVEEAPHVKWRLDPKKSGKTSCVGDIGTHAAHLAQFISGKKLTHVKADFHVCGSPKELEDTAFMNTKYDDQIPGTLMITRLASGKRGGLKIRIYGSKGGLEWDMEDNEKLKISRYGFADEIYTRGHGNGISKNIDRYLMSARGFSEGIVEAWGILYTELALSVCLKINKENISSDLLLPTVIDGLNGLKFIEASFNSSQNKGIWTSLNI